MKGPKGRDHVEIKKNGPSLSILTVTVASESGSWQESYHLQSDSLSLAVQYLKELQKREEKLGPPKIVGFRWGQVSVTNADYFTKEESST